MSAHQRNDSEFYLEVKPINPFPADRYTRYYDLKITARRVGAVRRFTRSLLGVIFILTAGYHAAVLLLAYRGITVDQNSFVGTLAAFVTCVVIAALILSGLAAKSRIHT